MGNITSHVREFAEGIGIHLGAQPQKSSDHRRTRRHLLSPLFIPLQFLASTVFNFLILVLGTVQSNVEITMTKDSLVLLSLMIFTIESYKFF